LGITSVFVMLVLSSCLSTDNKRNSVIQVFLQLKGTTTQLGRADTTLAAGNDSLTISNVRLITGKSQLIRDTSDLSLNPQMLRFSSTPSATGQAGNAHLMANGSGLAGVYQAIDFKIMQAEDSLRDNGIPIKDIFYDDGRY